MNAVKLLLDWFYPLAIVKRFTLWGGGGGGGSAPAAQTQTTVRDLPAWAQPYAQNVLSQGSALTANTQMPQYTGTVQDPTTGQNLAPGQRVAGFSGLQQQAQANAAGLTTGPNFDIASQLNQAAGLGALGTAGQAGMYGGMGAQAGMQGVMAGQQGARMGQAGMGYGAMGAQAGMQGQQIGTQGGLGYGAMGAQAGLGYGQQATDPNAVASYMNPYLQASLAPQLQLLGQQTGIAGANQQAAATQAGAFGGSRSALANALTQQTGQLAANTMIGNAYNQAYNTAQQNMQAAAQLGMQGAQTGLSGVNAALAGTAQGMQGAQTGISGLNAALAGNQQALQGAQTGISGAQAGLQGVGAQQAGYQTAAGTGTNLSNIGAQNLAAQQGIINTQAQQGAAQQALTQQAINTNYQNYLNQLNYPYQQLSYMSNLIQGTPMGMNQQSQVFQGPMTMGQTLGALGLGAYGLSQLAAKKGGLMKAKKFKKGGEVKHYDGEDGSVVTSSSASSPQMAKNGLEAWLSMMNSYGPAKMQTDNSGLTRTANKSKLVSPADAEYEAWQAQLKSEQQGLGSAYNQLPEEFQQGVLNYAHGGILAFAGDEDSNDPASGQMVGGQSSPGSPLYGQLLQKGMAMGDEAADFKPTQFTPAQEQDYLKQYTGNLQGLAGPNTAAQQYQQYLEQQDANRQANINRASGLAALQAIPALVQPGGFVRGIAGALGSFGNSMEKAHQADQLAQEKIAAAKFNLADSQRKERMGYAKEAQAAWTAHVKDTREAEKARQENVYHRMDAYAHLANAAKPLKAAGGAGTGAKLNEQLAAAEIAYSRDPSQANYDTVSGLRRAAAAVHTSDFGPNELALKKMEADNAVDAKVTAAMENAKKTAMVQPGYLEAKTKEEKEAFVTEAGQRAAAQARANFRSQQAAPTPTPTPGASRPPPPPGFQ